MKACESCTQWKQKQCFSWRKWQCPNKQGVLLPEETYLSSPDASQDDKGRTRLQSTPGMGGSVSLSACCQKLLIHQDRSQTTLMTEIYLITWVVSPRFAPLPNSVSDCTCGSGPLQGCSLDVLPTDKLPTSSRWQRSISPRWHCLSEKFP